MSKPDFDAASISLKGNATLMQPLSEFLKPESRISDNRRSSLRLLSINLSNVAENLLEYPLAAALTFTDEDLRKANMGPNTLTLFKTLLHEKKLDTGVTSSNKGIDFKYDDKRRAFEISPAEMTAKLMTIYDIKASQVKTVPIEFLEVKSTDGSTLKLTPAKGSALAEEMTQNPEKLSEIRKQMQNQLEMLATDAASHVPPQPEKSATASDPADTQPTRHLH